MPNYYLPPEWATQSAVMLTWPRPQGTWAAHFAAVEATYLNLTMAIAAQQRVIISCHDATQLAQARHKLATQGNPRHAIDWYIVPNQDTWARDHGPITVCSEQQALLLDFTFNGWGNKYPSDVDNHITRALYQQHAFPGYALHSHDMVLEGGSIETDGAGTLLTTEKCLLSASRNPQLTKTDIEKQLQSYFGVQRILWLQHGALPGDDTDSHVDTLARFCDAHTLCYNACPSATDPRYAGLVELEEELIALSQQHHYKRVALPLPSPRYNAEGLCLPANYVNFLIINNAVLVPTYADPADAIALTTLQTCFPTRQVIGIDCLALVEQFGSLHCATMQIPQLPNAR